MQVKNIIHSVYFNGGPLTEKECGRSRTLFIFEGASARTIFMLASGAFLAGFAEYLGGNDQYIGVVSAIPVLAGVVQLISPMVFEKLSSRKFLIAFLCFFHRILLGLMVFIPLIFSGTGMNLAVLAAVYLVSNMMVSFISPAVSGMIIDVTPEKIRGRYFGIRESYILVFATAVTLLMGRVLDIYKQDGAEYTGFVIVFTLILLLAAANFIFLSSVKEPPAKRSSVSPDLKKVITEPLKDQRFRKVVIMFFLWNIGVQVGGPFFPVYMVTGLNLQYSYIMLLNLLGTASNIITVRLWGNLADRRSWVHTTKLSLAVLAVTHAAWFFVDTGTVYIMAPILHILGGIAWAGINISIFNIQFTFAPEEGRTIYLGFNSALGGLVGFASTVIGSVLLGILAGFRLNMYFLNVGGMQVVFAVSGLLLGVCAGYIHRFMRIGGESG